MMPRRAMALVVLLGCACEGPATGTDAGVDAGADSGTAPADTGPFIDARARDAALPCRGSVTFQAPAAHLEPSPGYLGEVSAVPEADGTIVSWIEATSVGESYRRRLGRIADLEHAELVAGPEIDLDMDGSQLLVGAEEDVRLLDLGRDGTITQSRVRSDTLEVAFERTYSLPSWGASWTSFVQATACSGAPGLVPVIACTSEGGTGVSLLSTDTGEALPLVSEPQFQSVCGASSGFDFRVLGCAVTSTSAYALVRPGGSTAGPLRVIAWSGSSPPTVRQVGDDSRRDASGALWLDGDSLVTLTMGIDGTIGAWARTGDEMTITSETQAETFGFTSEVVGVISLPDRTVIAYSIDGVQQMYLLGWTAAGGLGLPYLVTDVGCDSGGSLVESASASYLVLTCGVPGFIATLGLCGGD